MDGMGSRYLKKTPDPSASSDRIRNDKNAGAIQTGRSILTNEMDEIIITSRGLWSIAILLENINLRDS
jgi:hypothetical protein